MPSDTQICDLTSDTLAQGYEEIVASGVAAIPPEVWKTLRGLVPENLLEPSRRGAMLMLADIDEDTTEKTPILREMDHVAELFFAVEHLRESFHSMTHMLDMLPTCDARLGAMAEIFALTFTLGYRCSERMREVEELQKLSSL